MDFLLTSIGSHGDIHPFVGMGATLKKRGHRVTLLVNEHFEPLVRKTGLDFIPLGDAETYRKLTEDPELWNGQKGSTVVLTALTQAIEPQFQAVMQRAIKGETTVVASSLSLGARLAQEVKGLPLVTVHLSPAIFRSYLKPPKFAGAYTPRWMPRSMVRGLFRWADRFIVDPILLPTINPLRRQHGLAPISNVFDAWIHSPDMVLGLFPEWFAPPVEDWPKQTRLTGFPLWDERDVQDLSMDMHHWLNEDNPPLVFTPGSAMRYAQEFFNAAVEACVRTGRRGLLLTRHPEHVPSNLPDLVRYEQYVPFSALLPRVAAIVHHGGIGTCAQGLAAGIRQIIMPMAHDQLDNADRLEKLGVAEVLPRRKFTGARLAKLITRMFSDRSYYVRCHWVSEWFHKERALLDSAMVLEDFAKERIEHRMPVSA
jgi:rhamnosyltransferase subunit B